MPSYYELETATSPMNSRRYPVSFMPMPTEGCPYNKSWVLYRERFILQGLRGFEWVKLRR